MVLLGALAVPTSIGSYLTNSTTYDDNDDDSNDSVNQKCYHAGFVAG